MNLPTASSVALLAVGVDFARADWQYRSRPDFLPPRLNITIPASKEVSIGYIFIATYPSFENLLADPEQTGAYIFRNDGDLVWSSHGYFAGLVANFQAVRYKGKPTTAYVSGNGDTVVKPWEFYGESWGTGALAKIPKLGSVARTSFETKLKAPLHKLLELGEEVEIFAVGLDAASKTLGQSEKVTVKADVHISVKISSEAQSALHPSEFSIALGFDDGLLPSFRARDRLSPQSSPLFNALQYRQALTSAQGIKVVFGTRRTFSRCTVDHAVKQSKQMKPLNNPEQKFSGSKPIIS
ncbi:hypothetical protein B0H63DRAFT_446105 [Podospora didyma]|uniref:Uncharacterized protein n=1 Tax=Podospora didyma TaxID=330526 RepID=A0AAE0U3S9_9PEZI|nr:hypothetical protein B0H63DRAFT_446105 [Podospora didyma]